MTESRWFSGNQIIPLDPDTPPGILVAGSAVVFAVDRQTSERVHLFSIEPGEPLLPIFHSADSGWNLVVVPLEASCVEQGTASPAAAAFALENWLLKIAEAMNRFCRKSDVQRARTGMVILSSGKCIAIDEGLLFVRLDVGEGLLSNAPVEQGATVALVPGLWLEASVTVPAEAEWTVMSGADHVEGVLKGTLDRVVPALLHTLRDARQRRAEEDRERLAQRKAGDRMMMSGAIGALSGLSRKPGAARPEAGNRAAEPLEAAVNAVAAALGVTLRPLPDAGRSPDRLRAIADASGLRMRTVLLAGAWWHAENGPLLAFRENGSPVALLPLTAGLFGRARYEIFDPAQNTRERVDAHTMATLNAFARMFYRPLPDDLSNKSLVRFLLASRRRDLRTIIVAGAIASLLGLAAPQGAAILIGQAIPDADTNIIWQVAAGMVAAAFGSAIFLLAQAIATLRAESSVFQTLQTGVWDYLLKLSPAYFRGFTVGQLRMRADAVTRIHQMLSADALRSVFSGIASFLSLALMFWYSPALGLLGLLSGIVLVAGTVVAAQSVFRLQEHAQELEELLSGLVLQAITAVSKLRVAGAANRAFAQWAQQYSRKQQYSVRIRLIRDRIRLLNMVIQPVATTLGFLYLLRSPIALGPFLACNAALNTFLAALSSASDTCVGMVLTANLWQRMRTILAAQPEVQSSSAHPGRLRGAVAVESLTFRYRDDGPLILDGVSLRAEPGECIALTGPSGSGKSTLLNLLLRFELPQSGGIYLDGREVSSLDIGAVRRQIGVVTQDGRVMAGSLFENICAGGSRTMDDAWEAARAAGLAADIENMPMGMHTIVSEGGGNLSGGQRQRVLIARALVLKPSILIFDEATSALDNRTQAIVTESLKRMNATRILVAHRLSTIRSADRIYVIEKGRVVQQGTYDQLVEELGLFRRLASRQTL